jgi:hypothetical protein
MQIIESIQATISESADIGDIRSALAGQNGVRLAMAVRKSKESTPSEVFYGEVAPYIAGSLRMGNRAGDAKKLADALATAGELLSSSDVPSQDQIDNFFVDWFGLSKSSAKKAGKLEDMLVAISKTVVKFLNKHSRSGSGRAIVGVVNDTIDLALGSKVDDAMEAFEMEMPGVGFDTIWRHAMDYVYMDHDDVAREYAPLITKKLFERITQRGFRLSGSTAKGINDAIADLIIKHANPPTLDNNHDYMIWPAEGENMSAVAREVDKDFVDILTRLFSGKI